MHIAMAPEPGFNCIDFGYWEKNQAMIPDALSATPPVRRIPMEGPRIENTWKSVI